MTPETHAAPYSLDGVAEVPAHRTYGERRPGPSASHFPLSDEDLVQEVVALPDGELELLRPRSSEALLDEHAFEQDEFMPYWAELWPSGVQLARVLAGRALHSARVLELGCGLGVPSMEAARCGARVLATDWSRAALALLERNATAAGLAVQTAWVDWKAPSSLVEQAPFDLVLAADVLYERRNVALLLRLLPQLAGEVWLADPDRDFARAFLERAREQWEIRSERRERVLIHRMRRREPAAGDGVRG